jgi:hypothetical protein
MKRREFLRATAAAPLLAALPTGLAPAVKTLYIYTHEFEARQRPA